MRQSWHVASAAMLVLALAVVAGCGPAKEPGQGSDAGGPRRLIVAQPFDARNLDPGVQIDSWSMNIYVNIFDSLMKRDENMVPQPRLAETVTRVDDLTWEIKLRPNVKFHNGEPLNAEAVKFTIERIFDPATKSVLPTWLKGIESVEVVNELTARVHTSAPMPLMLQNLVMIYPVPPGYVREVGNEQFNLRPVGTGPYKLKEWQRDDHATLVAFEDHWEGRPAYDKVTFRFIPDEEGRVSALLAGDVDLVVGLPAASRDRVASQEGLAVRDVEIGRVFLLQLAVTDGYPFLEDRRVRQAIAHAIDTDAIIEHVALGAASKLKTILNPKNFGHNPALDAYSYDPDRARALLRDAGYGDGFPFVINTTSDRKDVAEAIAGQLRQVRIDAQVAVHESGEFLKGWRAHNLGGHAFLLGLLSQTWDADGLLYLRFAEGEPMSYYSTPDVDRLVKAGRTTMEPEARREIYRELTEILHEEMPIIPIYGMKALYGAKAGIRWTPRADELLYLYEAAPE